jgi:hypothetical protein
MDYHVKGLARRERGTIIEKKCYRNTKNERR